MVLLGNVKRSILLALQGKSRVALPLIYGSGTAAPVLVFAGIIALSAQSLGEALQVLSSEGWWARMVTGGIFLSVGIGVPLKYLFEVIYGHPAALDSAAGDIPGVRTFLCEAPDGPVSGK